MNCVKAVIDSNQAGRDRRARNARLTRAFKGRFVSVFVIDSTQRCLKNKRPRHLTRPLSILHVFYSTATVASSS